MSARFVVAAGVVAGIAVAAWFHRDALPFHGDGSTPETAATLKAAGVHKCVGGGRTSYIDGPCPAGTREVAATGGTVTVTSFPRPAPSPAALASSAFGGPLVKPMDPAERDRLREKAVDDAMNRR